MLGKGWNLGAWGGYDVRSTSLGSTFSQMSGGVEALSKNWDLRINGYVPFDESETISSSSISTGGGAPTVLLNGNSILLQTGLYSTTSTLAELALGGFDTEIGMRLPVEALTLDPAKIDLRLYGGGFYFDNDKADKAVAGPKARAELRFNDVIAAAPGSRLTLETEYTYDEVRGDRLEAGARFRIPLGGGQSFAAQNAQQQRMTEGLRRDTDIVASSKTTTVTVNTLTTEGVTDAATNVDLNQVAYADGATAGGISAVATAQGANTLIIAQGGNGNIASNALLQSQQTLVGGSGTITLNGKTTGISVQFTAPGSKPTIDGQAGNYAVRLVDDTHVAGLDINVGAATGGVIVGSGSNNTVTQNVAIESNTIAANAKDGIVTSTGVLNASSSQVMLSDNTITSAGNGISVFETTNSEILRNTISGASGNGLSIASGVSSLNVQDNLISTAGNAPGILLSGNNDTLLDISGNSIVSEGPIVVTANAVSGTISNNSLDALGFNGVRFIGSASTLTGAGNAFSNGTLCSSNGLNGGSNIQFVGGATCP
jgi:parallel beta-helix repeat protein